MGGRSLLNRNAAGAFRFSHYSIQEFLVVHALAMDAAEAPLAPVRVTAQMLEYLAFVHGLPAMDRLDLTGLQPGALAGFSFRDRLADGSSGPRMQLVPPGSFAMGSPDEDASASDAEKPQHQVTIPRAFALGRHPVTFEEYDRFAAATGRDKPPDQGWGRGSRPAINVSWEDAVAYCDWLSEQTGRRYHLPTEAQWEYACRAGGTARYCFGDRESDLGDYAWYRDNADGKTHPVGEKKPNPWGLHDLHGNVWEWVEDVWHGDYDGAPNDGSAWIAGGDGSRRVLRGGSWYSFGRLARSARRNHSAPDDRYYNLGFRPARGQS